MDIIPLTNKHYKEYILLMNEFREVDINMTLSEFDTIYNKIKNNGIILVCFIDNCIVGSITVVLEQKFIHNGGIAAHIEDVYVSRNHRKSGIGTKLLEKAKEFCEKMNCYKIVLYCSDELTEYYKKHDYNIYGNVMKIKLN